MLYLSSWQLDAIVFLALWKRTRRLDGIIDSVDLNWNKLQAMMKDREVWRAAVHGVSESDMTERLNSNNMV